VRLQILQLLAAVPMTTKQVAIQLGEPITGLYRHVDALAAAGLIRLVAEVPKRGTVQKFFRAAATSFKVEEGCLSGPASGDARHQAILEILNETRRGIAHGFASSRDIPVLAGASLVELHSVEEAREVSDVISKALQTWSRSRRKSRAAKRPPAVTLSRLAFFIHPAASGGSR
jgi:DNA-binding transcriptional ArsR family regulator